jgi:hypothetical protein
MGRSRQQAGIAVAEAPSVRKDEVFRATRTGLERLQKSKLRGGGEYNRLDELPYHRIASLSYEERVTTRGSKVLSVAGAILLLVGLGIPAFSSLMSMVSLHVPSSRIAGLTDSLALPNLTVAALGIGLLASKFPRRSKERWWQVKGLDLTPEDQRGWQVAAGEKGAEELVRAVKEGVSRTTSPGLIKNPGT